jgi:hypothetical protein
MLFGAVRPIDIDRCAFLVGRRVGAVALPRWRVRSESERGNVNLGLGLDWLLRIWGFSPGREMLGVVLPLCYFSRHILGGGP